ncbi:Nuclear receptor-interacting protein 3 [Bienertia sinuspersici]
MRTDPESRGQTKYCYFHRDIGHHTNDYFDLKKTLDSLASQGKISQHLIKSQDKGKKIDHSSQPKTSNDEFPEVLIGEKDRGKIRTPHDDPLVVELKVANKKVRRILVDTGISIDIISLECLRRLMGEKENSKGMYIKFLVVTDLSAYNIILGRPTLNAAKAVVVTYLMLMKFECDDGSVGTLRGDQKIARDCYYTTVKDSKERSEQNNEEKVGKKRKLKQAEPEQPEQSKQEELLAVMSQDQTTRAEALGEHEDF